MSEHHNITPEEMSALLPDYEVSQDSWRRVKKRLIGRLMVVTLLYLLCVVIFFFYPEYHIDLFNHEFGITEHMLFGLGFYRPVLMVFLLLGYLRAIRNNAYLRTVAIIALIVTFAMLWSDLELLFFHPQGYQWSLILPSAVRIVAIYLLFKNYLDIRQ
jgi:Na+-driven multidrug efflux pump